MLRPTRSKDGQFRVSVRIEHRLDDHLISLAALSAASHDECEIESLSRTRIEQELRDMLTNTGFDGLAFWESDDLEDEDRVRARRHVLKLWPSLQPKTLIDNPDL